VKRRRGTAVAIALLGAALAAAGCGLGPGADVGSVELKVTREFGSEPVLRHSLEAKESDTVMRALEVDADVQTRFGGGFVHSIDGVAEGEHGGDPYDWFFFVDGVESPIGAADVDLKGGERIWWDYRDWSATNHVPGVVGSWPAPFTDGVAGEDHPVALECAGGGDACDAVRKALEDEGVKLSSGSPERAIRILVGPWDRLRQDPAARLLEEGPAESGIYADFDGGGLEALDENGASARRLGSDAGLVAATSRYGGPPVWLVTGGTAAAVREAAVALDEEHLRDHYAVAIRDGKETPLPLKAE
jgi:Domain of unknown function (DUF4430)